MAIQPELPFRDRERAERLAVEIRRTAQKLDRDIRIMEVCGTHTVSLRRYGIHSLLPRSVHLISGPGCPVCVTPSGFVANALRLIEDHRLTIATFGDMVKVPDPDGKSLSGHLGSGKVRIIYSPLELIEMAAETDGPLVFLGIGFETTIPAVVSVFERARDRRVRNLFLSAAFKTVPPALRAIVSDPECAIDAFLLPGHVSVVIGVEPYRFLAEEYGLPGVIAGFEPVDMLGAILRILVQLAERKPAIENAYPRAVRNSGNAAALAIMERTLVPGSALWRGLGRMEGSGLRLRDEYREMDADRVFSLPEIVDHDPPGCLCGRVIQGKTTPPECPLFGRSCTPDQPVGPCMVSSEGTCAAYLKYREGVE